MTIKSDQRIRDAYDEPKTDENLRYYTERLISAARDAARSLDYPKWLMNIIDDAQKALNNGDTDLRSSMHGMKL